MAISKSMYLIQICIDFYFFFFFYRSHFGAPARRKLGMRKNSESQDHVDVSRRVQKTPMKAKDRFFEAGELQFLFVSNCHYLPF